MYWSYRCNNQSINQSIIYHQTRDVAYQQVWGRNTHAADRGIRGSCVLHLQTCWSPENILKFHVVVASVPVLRLVSVAAAAVLPVSASLGSMWVLVCGTATATRQEDLDKQGVGNAVGQHYHRTVSGVVVIVLGVRCITFG